MAISYRLEYLKNPSEPSNEAVFLQLRESPKATDWVDRVRKQDYEGGTSPLADAIFAVAGVTELSIQPFRIWFSKSPIYTWEETIFPVLNLMAVSIGDSGWNETGAPIFLEEASNRLEP